MKGLLDKYHSEASPQGRCLWPDEYAADDGDTAFKFLTECWWTDNEADSKIELIPADDLTHDFCHLWTYAFNSRAPLIVEKSRRIRVSWMARGLETWTMGKARGQWMIVDQTHSNAAEHLWRCDFSLKQLYERRKNLHLTPHEVRGAVMIKEPTTIILPNGSIMKHGHQDAGASQGKGMTGLTLEEISKYKAASTWWGQALIVTQGSTEGTGGWVNGIANASTNEDWKDIKGKMKPREFLGIRDEVWI